MSICEGVRGSKAGRHKSFCGVWIWLEARRKSALPCNKGLRMFLGVQLSSGGIKGEEGCYCLVERTGPMPTQIQESCAHHESCSRHPWCELCVCSLPITTSQPCHFLRKTQDSRPSRFACGLCFEVGNFRGDGTPPLKATKSQFDGTSEHMVAAWPESFQ